MVGMAANPTITSAVAHEKDNRKCVQSNGLNERGGIRARGRPSATYAAAL